MTKQEAIELLTYLISELGLAYHPDTSLDEYTTMDRKQLFTDEQVILFSFRHSQMMETIDVYAEGWRLWKELGFLTDADICQDDCGH